MKPVYPPGTYLVFSDRDRFGQPRSECLFAGTLVECLCYKIKHYGEILYLYLVDAVQSASCPWLFVKPVLWPDEEAANED